MLQTSANGKTCDISHRHTYKTYAALLQVLYIGQEGVPQRNRDTSRKRNGPLARMIGQGVPQLTIIVK